MENLTIKLALHAWDVQLTRTTKVLEILPNDTLLKQIAPGKNRGVYVLGHLIAVDDAISEIMGTGKRVYPELFAPFVQEPDNLETEIPSVDELKNYWNLVHDRLKQEFITLAPADWFGRHNSMTDEDFEKDPSRNKLSVLLNRTGHLAYHLGQLRLLY